MTKTTALVWLRRDLRLEDNAALTAACRDHDAVIAVYCLDDAISMTGSAARVRLHQSLKKLSQSTDSTNISIVFDLRTAEQALPDVAIKCGATALYYNKLYEPAASQRERAVTDAWAGPSYGFAGHLLIDPAAHGKADGTPYRVFTPFWKSLRPKLQNALPPLPRARSKTKAQLPAGVGVPLDALGLMPSHDWATALSRTFMAGEAHAQQCLNQLVTSKLSDYAAARDQMAEDGTSNLSAALHFGEISPTQILHALNGQPGAEAFLRQLAWRDFAHHLLFHFPETQLKPLNPKFTQFDWRTAAQENLLFSTWTQGNTGISLVDAAMKQLWQTGTMHNRARMVTASVLVKNMRIDWRDGARWFWDCLIDADMANNVMGWQWVAGCGADAAPFFRIFNPDLQAKKFDPDGLYRARWLGQDWQADYQARKPVIDLKASRQDALTAYAQIK